MNKAFVREPDNVEPLCPKCGGVGERVPVETLHALVPATARRTAERSSYFCLTPNCDVAYYDDLEQVIAAAELVRPVYPKDTRAPVCPCFGLTEDDIDDDVFDGVPRRIRELVAKTKSAAARCGELSPTGRCCLTEVQRLYFRRKAEFDSRRT